MTKHHFQILSVLLMSVFLTACESSEEKKERVRLEKLFNMDNTEIANAFERGVLKAPFVEVRKLCEAEKIKKNPGKWCAKWDAVKAAWKPVLIIPKLVR